MGDDRPAAQSRLAPLVTDAERTSDPEHGSIISTTVTIGYDAPWPQVHPMLLLAAERSGYLRKKPKPRVLQRALRDFYVEYRLIFSQDKSEAQSFVVSEVHAHIQDVFNEFGVPIMSPHLERQPEEKVWVPKAAWFEPPAGTTASDLLPAERRVASAVKTT